MSQSQKAHASEQLLDQRKSVALMDTIMKKVQNGEVYKGSTIRKGIPHSNSRAIQRRAYFMQTLMAIVANLSVLSIGMGLGFPAITLESLQDPTSDMALSTEQASWFASVNTFVCPVGGILCSIILDRLGRKVTLIIVNLISILSWGIMAFSSQTNFHTMYVQLLVSRVLIGINLGLSSMPSTVYAAEISSPNIRGRLTALTSFTIALGVLIIYMLGYFFPTNWRLVSGIACLMCVVSGIILIPLPESPSWLVTKGRERHAEKSLRIFRGVHGDTQREDIDQELQDMIIKVSTDRNIRGKSDSAMQLLRQPDVYKPLFLMIGFFFFQQTAGIFVLIVYAAKFIKEANVGMQVFLCTVIIGAVRVAATACAAIILDKFGRKPPTILSGICMSISMFGLAIYNYLQVDGVSWVPSMLLLVYIVTATIGFHAVPFAMNAEIFPRKARGLACGLTVGCGYFISFICIKLYPTMVEHMSSVAIFSIYGGFALAGTIFVKFLVFETKGKSLQEIEEYFKGKNPEHEMLNGVSFIAR